MHETTDRLICSIKEHTYILRGDRNMKRELAFDFSVEKENNSIRIKKEFDGPNQLVWDGWTTADLLDQWWGPQPWHVETKTLDFTINGIWHYAMVGPEGEKHWNLSQFIAIEEGQSFMYKDGFCDEHGIINQDMPQGTWLLSFSEAENTTLVDCKISMGTSEELQTILDMGFQEGISMCLKQLDALLERTLNTQE